MWISWALWTWFAVWVDLVWCLVGESSLMQSFLRPLFLPHLIKAMRMSWCELVSIAVDLHEIVLALTLGHTVWPTLPAVATLALSNTLASPQQCVDCGSTWNWPPLYPLYPHRRVSYHLFQLISFSTLLSESYAQRTPHARGLPAFQQTSFFGWWEEILYKSSPNRQNAELRLNAISLLMI